MFNITTPNGPDTTDPFEIDWATRQARAVVPFVLADGLPVNPCQPELDEGRGGLWHWGEAVAADAVVFAMDPATGRRSLLMVERDDDHGWALPGGMLDAGETPAEAVARELAEETGLELPQRQFVMRAGRYVPDPRAGRHAWMVTVPGIATLVASRMPAVVGCDDARYADWLPADTYAHLRAAVDARGGTIFGSHQTLLRELL